MSSFHGCAGQFPTSPVEPPATQDDEETAAVRAWARLSSALSKTTPPCDGDPQFTGGHLREPDRELLAAICASCPVLQLCDEYADSARISWGVWGGVDRSRPHRKTTATGTASRQSNNQENRS